jgi:hypothetical protein
MPEMIEEQRPAHPPERLLNRRHLSEHVDTVSLLLHHLLNASHLALDPAEPGNHRVLDLGIDFDRL